jgi:hypothetical protein
VLLNPVDSELGFLPGFQILGMLTSGEHVYFGSRGTHGFSPIAVYFSQSDGHIPHVRDLLTLESI